MGNCFPKGVEANSQAKDREQKEEEIDECVEPKKQLAKADSVESGNDGLLLENANKLDKEEGEVESGISHEGENDDQILENEAKEEKLVEILPQTIADEKELVKQGKEEKPVEIVPQTIADEKELVKQGKEEKSVEIVPQTIADEKELVKQGKEKKSIEIVPQTIADEKELVKQDLIAEEEIECILCPDSEPVKTVEVKLDSVEVLEKVQPGLIASDNAVACVLDEPQEVSILRKYFNESEASQLRPEIPESLADPKDLDKFLSKLKSLCFDMIDAYKDRDGEITEEEYAMFLSKATKMEPSKFTSEVREIIQTHDLDGNGSLNFYEFAKMMIHKHH